ncbi:LamG domain-containing protein [Microbacter margulisiae]|uniref:LamG-like jellyroll fold domain-containing protein n=1 Tax=Microbacter margulisiae TaxID=1350067 RepID=A0A7W5DNI5_9PORP|nr:LamG domain-containing protein [Microbacter margulisiae]MBB3186205.1 hypothetical protein [Microbacter margulisiae]
MNVKYYFLKIILSLIAVSAIGTTFANCSNKRFYAYYTKLGCGETWEKYSRTSEFADVVVHLRKGQLVFWRGTSYLPVWKTSNGKWPFEEIVPRKGDGSALMPDRTNTFSNVEIIINTPKKIIIHWRYLPVFSAGNPFIGVKSNNFVDEYFTIFSNGYVVREIDQYSTRIDSRNKIIQYIKLNKNEVKYIRTYNVNKLIIHNKCLGNPVLHNTILSPLLCWHFDEGIGDSTKESVSQKMVFIKGEKAYWRSGISGTALAFDGYKSQIDLDKNILNKINGRSLTVQTWFAIGAYPFNQVPIIQQCDDDAGFFLGIDGYGYPAFKIKTKEGWAEVNLKGDMPFKNKLKIFKWYCLTGVYNKKRGEISLYINGQKVASRKDVGNQGLEASHSDLLIGKSNKPLMPIAALHDTYPSDFGFDGLIDEISIFNKALSQYQIFQSFQAMNPGNAIVSSPNLEKRELPKFNTHGEFKADYTNLHYIDTWDNLFRFGKYADVVVGFDDSPIRYIFWHGMSYIPMISDNNNHWYTNEFNEFYTDADYEPMSDKPCFSSHVRIIENTDARVVVQWRYRLITPWQKWSNYDSKTGWGDVSEMIYYIYPDGVSTKRLRIWTSSSDNPEWQESIPVFGENVHPENVICKSPFMCLIDSSGHTSSYDWVSHPPKNVKYKGNIIQKIHFCSGYNPFTIQKFKDGNIYNGEINWYSIFPTFNHWPISQIISSGRNAIASDRPVSVSLSHVYWKNTFVKKGDIQYRETSLMEGMSKLSDSALALLAKSWLYAPMVSEVKGCMSFGYDMEQRAYIFSANNRKISFFINASAKHPIDNLCLVIKNWDDNKIEAKLKIDGKKQLQGPDFRQGCTIAIDGSVKKLIWLKISTEKRQSFEIYY